MREGLLLKIIATHCERKIKYVLFGLLFEDQRSCGQGVINVFYNDAERIISGLLAHGKSPTNNNAI